MASAAGATGTLVAGEPAEVFLEVRDVPVHVGVLWPSAEAARTCPRGDIRLAYAPRSGFIANQAFDPARVDYGLRYDNALHFSPYFQAFEDRLARRPRDRRPGAADEQREPDGEQQQPGRLPRQPQRQRREVAAQVADEAGVAQPGLQRGEVAVQLGAEQQAREQQRLAPGASGGRSHGGATCRTAPSRPTRSSSCSARW